MSSRYGLEIRAAAAADAPGLSALLGAHGHVVAPGLLASRLGALHDAHGIILVALEWGPPSGLVMLHWYPVLMSDQPIAQITLLLVGRDDRRRGIGRLLVKAASQAARVAGCGALELLAPDHQPELRAFCQATGFVASGAHYERVLRKKGPSVA